MYRTIELRVAAASDDSRETVLNNLGSPEPESSTFKTVYHAKSRFRPPTVLRIMPSSNAPAYLYNDAAAYQSRTMMHTATMHDACLDLAAVAACDFKSHRKRPQSDLSWVTAHHRIPVTTDTTT
jgi:hypothetical protein